jgi:flagellar basal-body rod protein FlgG
MTETIQSIARSLSADIATLNTISHNIANLNTPGFRAERAVPGFDAHLGVDAMGTARDLSDGALTQTGRPLDLALRGEGFFVVERNGAPVLVRSGQFRLDADGQLVNANGDRVLGESGALTLENEAVRVDGQGELWSGDRSLGRLRLVGIGDPARLEALDAGGFRYDGERIAWQGKVEQGVIEHANVDAADESIRLMELTRHVESVQRAIAIYDKAMETGVNRLGEN